MEREDLLDFMEESRTDDDVSLMRESVDAEARGDAATALDLYRRSLHVPGLPHETLLETMALLGRAAPPWAWARWIVHQAWMHMLLTDDDRAEQAVRTTLVTCYDLTDMDERALRECGTVQASSNRVASDLALHHLGGLAEHAERVAPWVRDAAGDLDAWIAAPMRAYRYEFFTDPFLTVQDLRDGTEHRLYDLGCLDGSMLGATVVGRIVPDGGGGQMFDARPISVDEVTAIGIARDTSKPSELGPAWLTHLFAGRSKGALPDGVGAVESHVLCDRLGARPEASAPIPGLLRLMSWTPSAGPSLKRQR